MSSIATSIVVEAVLISLVARTSDTFLFGDFLNRRLMTARSLTFPLAIRAGDFAIGATWANCIALLSSAPPSCTRSQNPGGQVGRLTRLANSGHAQNGG